MASKAEYMCIREKQINKHDADIAELKTRAEYKERQIIELGDNMREMNQKLDYIRDGLQDLKLQSMQDDSDIDNRVTALENTVKVLKWVSATALSVLGVLIAVLSFAMMHLH